eukprot:Rmarinus@m.14519
MYDSPYSYLRVTHPYAFERLSQLVAERSRQMKRGNAYIEALAPARSSKVAEAERLAYSKRLRAEASKPRKEGALNKSKEVRGEEPTSRDYDGSKLVSNRMRPKSANHHSRTVHKEENQRLSYSGANHQRPSSARTTRTTAQAPRRPSSAQHRPRSAVADPLRARANESVPVGKENVFGVTVDGITADDPSLIDREVISRERRDTFKNLVELQDQESKLLKMLEDIQLRKENADGKRAKPPIRQKIPHSGRSASAMHRMNAPSGGIPGRTKLAWSGHNTKARCPPRSISQQRTTTEAHWLRVKPKKRRTAGSIRGTPGSCYAAIRSC